MSGGFGNRRGPGNPWKRGALHQSRTSDEGSESAERPNEAGTGRKRLSSERAAELGRRSGEARRQRRDAPLEGATEVPVDLAGWTDARLVALARNDHNPAAAVSALRELRARTPEPERELVSGEARGTSLMDMLDNLAIDWRDEAIRALAGALAAGYDGDLILTAARARHSKATATGGRAAGVSEKHEHVARVSPERSVDFENSGSGTPGPEEISNGSAGSGSFAPWPAWGDEGGRNGVR